MTKSQQTMYFIAAGAFFLVAIVGLGSGNTSAGGFIGLAAAFYIIGLMKDEINKKKKDKK